GRHALSGSADATLRLWDIGSGRNLTTFQGHQDVVTSVALTPDGAFALSGSADGTLKLWEVAGGRCLAALTGHADPVQAVSLSSDARYAVSGGAQFLIRSGSERLFTSGQLLLWELTSGRCLRSFPVDAEGVTAVFLSPDARYAVAGGGRS